MFLKTERRDKIILIMEHHRRNNIGEFAVMDNMYTNPGQEMPVTYFELQQQIEQRQLQEQQLKQQQQQQLQQQQQQMDQLSQQMNTLNFSVASTPAESNSSPSSSSNNSFDMGRMDDDGGAYFQNDPYVNEMEKRRKDPVYVSMASHQITGSSSSSTLSSYPQHSSCILKRPESLPRCTFQTWI